MAAKLKGILLVAIEQDENSAAEAGNITSSTDYLFHQQQKSVQHSLQQEQGMLLERERRVRQIEADVIDVNEIMRDLLPMLQDQGETIGKLSVSVNFDSEKSEKRNSTSALKKDLLR